MPDKTDSVNPNVAALMAELSKAQYEAKLLRGALEPFVRAYENVDRMFCPEFKGMDALGWFENARRVLNAR